MHGHELIAHLFPHRPPEEEETAMKLDAIRGAFHDVADELVDQTAVTPEQAIAIRKTHEAMQAWITAVVLHQ